MLHFRYRHERCSTLIILVLSLFLSRIDGAIYHSSEDLPQYSFDFVVVGGGTAGCVLDNRLTENPNFSVLLIEAGPSNENVLNSEVPGFAFNIANTIYDWNFTLTAQLGLNGRSAHFERGHVLGGSSSVNGMVYTRGSSDDFDRFARVTGDPGWSWSNIQPYIRRNEKWTAPADGHNTFGQFNPKVHSLTGINFVSLPGFDPPSPNDKIIQTTEDLKDEFPFNLDMNSGSPLGVGWTQSTIGFGARSSAATSYLGLEFVIRPNLHILLQTIVTHVLRTNNSSAFVPEIRTVEILGNTTNSIIPIIALKEVVLSAGSIGTPHILLNSGIGDQAELNAVGITTILDNPSVGKICLITLINTTEALAEWTRNRTGPLTQFGSPKIGFTRLPTNSTIFQTFEDPSAGSNTPHTELELFAGGDIFFSGVGVGVVLVTPISCGSITLSSNDPLADPVIDPAFLQSQFDIFAMRESVRIAQRFFAGPAWAGFIIGPLSPTADVLASDALLDDFIRNTTNSNAHPCGTAAMSPKGANYGVVDPDLKLKGAKGIRVVDASIMPFITSGHTQAPVYIISERAANIITAAWL